jgi:rare lipoprotein A
MIRTLWLAAGTSAAALILAVAIFALMTVSGLAAGCPHGTQLASWYGRESCHRTPCRTADGTRFDGSQMVAASLSLPLGSTVLVRNVQNGRIVQVRVADRGPAPWTGRVLDLSRAAAAKLGMIGAGTACVSIDRLG